MNYRLQATKEMGRGLYATTAIKAGTIITQCELLVLSQRDTVSVNLTELQYYTFKYDADRDCLCLGDGELFNHAGVPNVGYKLETTTCSGTVEDAEPRQVMVFYALIDIDAGQQLFIDYAADTNVNTMAYIENKSLI